jgi:hypothetical protein
MIGEVTAGRAFAAAAATGWVGLGEKDIDTPAGTETDGTAAGEAQSY